MGYPINVFLTVGKLSFYLSLFNNIYLWSMSYVLAAGQSPGYVVRKKRTVCAFTEVLTQCVDSQTLVALEMPGRLHKTDCFGVSHAAGLGQGLGVGISNKFSTDDKYW